MSIKRVVPDIMSQRMDESRKFYTEFPGFDVAMDMGWVLTFASPQNPTAQITVVRQTLSTFHLRAQRTAVHRRGVRLQSRLFVRQETVQQTARG